MLGRTALVALLVSSLSVVPISATGKFAGMNRAPALLEALESQEFESENSSRPWQYSAVASWYKHGRVTANGERFNKRGLTAAHRTLPFGTTVRLTEPESGKSVVVRINDRGPYIRGREFDVTERVAEVLDIKDRGVVRLTIEILQ